MKVCVKCGMVMRENKHLAARETVIAAAKNWLLMPLALSAESDPALLLLKAVRELIAIEKEE